MAQRIADELNRIVQDDLDFLSDDATALQSLLDEYMSFNPEEEVAEEEEELPDSWKPHNLPTEGAFITLTLEFFYYKECSWLYR